MVRVLRAADRRQVPWKNGGGVTAEIAISPGGAALDAFDWRVSTAVVAADGPFSRFEGIDRQLVVLDGALRLVVDGRQPLDLTPLSPPAVFPGEAATHAALTGGPVRDLNIMTRRGVVTATIAPMAAGAEVAAGAGDCLLFAVTAAEGTVVGALQPGDALLLGAGGLVRLGHGGVLAIHFQRAAVLPAAAI